MSPPVLSRVPSGQGFSSVASYKRAYIARSAGATGYQVSRSLRFNSADSAYLSRTPGSAGNRRTWTFSCWIKRAKLGEYQAIFSAAPTAGTDDNRLTVRFDNDDKLRVFHDIGGAATTYRLTAQVFRDISAWYHFVFVFNTTLATANDRVKVYVNGEQITTFSSSANPTLDFDTAVNNAAAHRLGSDAGATARYFDGYLADIYLLDGTATDPSTFAETDAVTGQWVPKTPTGISYGTNGFRLPFSDNSGTTSTTLGKDSAGSNNWTPNNFSVASGSGNDSLVDTPSSYGTDDSLGGSVRGNYCTWNPLAKNSALNLANGNLDDSTGTPGIDGIGLGTIGASVGKFYWELTVNSTSGGNNPIIGVVPTSAGLIEVGSNNANSVGYLQSGSKRINGSTTSYGNSFTTGDVVGVALDLDNGAIYFSKNGTWQNSGVPTSGSSKTGAAHTWTGGSVEMTPAVREYNSSCSANWGQRSWAYQAPAGFKALVDTNLTAPVIAKPNTVFDVITWSGSGGARSFTGLGFSPDLVWGKQRNGANSHQIYDIVRGAGNNKDLASDLTAAEGSATTSASVYGYLSSFDSTGFSVANGTDSGFPAGYWNHSGRTYVAWAWDAGSAANPTTNNAGSISSQVRANATSGFSVATFTGATTGTIGHGLGVAPSMIIMKARTSNPGANDWFVYHKDVGNTKALLLNSTAAPNTYTYWNNTSPTSTVFSIGSGLGTPDWVAYVFSPVAGYSSFGSYTGNGSSDGPFVFCGFRPRWLLVKSVNYADTWVLIDAARETYNVMNTQLRPNSSNAESVAVNDAFDFLSNGFKVRGGGAVVNTSSAPFIYAAFAESPFQYARAR